VVSIADALTPYRLARSRRMLILRLGVLRYMSESGGPAKTVPTCCISIPCIFCAASYTSSGLMPLRA
jgi:hypothetical protein